MLAYLLGVMVAGSWISVSFSEGTTKKQEMRRYLSERKFSAQLAKDPGFCSAFLNDFMSQEHLTYIDPAVVVHRYDDHALQVFLKNYPAIELRSPILGRSGTYVGPRTFKIFEVNMSDKSDGEAQYLFLESAFYTVRGRATNYEPMIRSATRYRLIDMTQCKSKGTIYIGRSKTFDPETDISKEDPASSYHGVIAYKDRSYVYDLVTGKGYGHVLSVYSRDMESPSGFSPICRFKEPRPIVQLPAGVSME
jgi:hypothetical protein